MNRRVQRCREQMDQCQLPDGSKANAECFRVPTHHAWECPNCGRRYPALHDWMYRDEVAG